MDDAWRRREEREGVIAWRYAWSRWLGDCEAPTNRKSSRLIECMLWERVCWLCVVVAAADVAVVVAVVVVADVVVVVDDGVVVVADAHTASEISSSSVARRRRRGRGLCGGDRVTRAGEMPSLESCWEEIWLCWVSWHEGGCGVGANSTDARLRVKGLRSGGESGEPLSMAESAERERLLSGPSTSGDVLDLPMPLSDRREVDEVALVRVHCCWACCCCSLWQLLRASTCTPRKPTAANMLKRERASMCVTFMSLVMHGNVAVVAERPVVVGDALLANMRALAFVSSCVCGGVQRVGECVEEHSGAAAVHALIPAWSGTATGA